MTLRGTLDTVGLADLLQVLCATTKTGCLRIEVDRGSGRVWVRDGAVAAAATDRAHDAPLDEAMSDLLRHRTGSFTFDSDEQSPPSDAHENLSDLLDRAYALLDERRELEATVPSLDHRVRLMEVLPEGVQATITASQWPILVRIGDGCTVADLATGMGLTELDALRTVSGLVTSGLASVEPPRYGDQRAKRIKPRLA